MTKQELTAFESSAADCQFSRSARSEKPKIHWNSLTAPIVPEDMSEIEVLEGFLVHIVPHEHVLPLAERLLESVGSLSAIFGASLERLASIEQCNLAIANQLKILAASAVALAYRRVDERPNLLDTESTLSYLRTRFSLDIRRMRYGLYVDEQQRLIRGEMISVGTIDHAVLYPRSVVHRAIDLNASGIILASSRRGDVRKPNRAEIVLTRNLDSALSVFEIQLHDHLIVGPYGHLSLGKFNRSRRLPGRD